LLQLVIELGSAGSTITLTNGLVTRTFATTPNFATIEYRNEADGGTTFIRGVSPEARIFVDK
jgi:hypothetical protein